MFVDAAVGSALLLLLLLLQRADFFSFGGGGGGIKHPTIPSKIFTFLLNTS